MKILAKTILFGLFLLLNGYSQQEVEGFLFDFKVIDNHTILSTSKSLNHRSINNTYLLGHSGNIIHKLGNDTLNVRQVSLNNNTDILVYLEKYRGIHNRILVRQLSTFEEQWEYSTKNISFKFSPDSRFAFSFPPHFENSGDFELLKIEDGISELETPFHWSWSQIDWLDNERFLLLQTIQKNNPDYNAYAIERKQSGQTFTKELGRLKIAFRKGEIDSSELALGKKNADIKFKLMHREFTSKYNVRGGGTPPPSQYIYEGTKYVIYNAAISQIEEEGELYDLDSNKVSLRGVSSYRQDLTIDRDNQRIYLFCGDEDKAFIVVFDFNLNPLSKSKNVSRYSPLLVLEAKKGINIYSRYKRIIEHLITEFDFSMLADIKSIKGFRSGFMEESFRSGQLIFFPDKYSISWKHNKE